MSRVFVDTSAILALVNPDDRHHRKAVRIFERLRGNEAGLVSTSFVLLETYAIVGSRVGLDAVGALRADFAPLLDVVWVDRDLFERSLDRLLGKEAPRVSLVDTASFLVMRRERIDDAFVFDRHFAEAGFSALD